MTNTISRAGAVPVRQDGDYQVRRGDTLSAIAHRHGLSLRALIRANPQLRDIDLIRPHEIIHLPAARVHSRHQEGVQAGQGTGVIDQVRQRPATSAANVAAIAEQYLNRNAGELSADRTDALPMRAGVNTHYCCANFVSAVLVEAGLLPAAKQTTLVRELDHTLRQRGWTEVSPAQARPGDVVIIQGSYRGHRVSHTEIIAGPGQMIGSNNRNRDHSQRITYDNLSWAVAAGAKILRAPGGNSSVRLTAPAPVQPTGVSAGSRTELLARLGSVIAHGEGGYESYNTGTKGVAGGRVGHSYVAPPEGTVTGRTINEILATGTLSGNDSNRMFATGKYQTTLSTLRAARDAMGLTGNERYTPELQERVFREFLLGKAGGGRLAAFINEGRGTVDDAQYAAAQEWASIAVPAGRTDGNGVVSDGTRSYYERAGTNSASRSATAQLRALLTELQGAR